jgi:hypothetical protein
MTPRCLPFMVPMLIPALCVGLCAGLGLGVSPAARGAPPEAASEADEPDEVDDASEVSELEQAEPDRVELQPDHADQAPAQIVDVVLPCGLRVITAKDATLPVAAVVLALELGTRDDPDNLPGLIHALAYHLQQGNRELAPGEGIATAHDVGGLAAMAVGVAQVRYESLVPISQLDRQLRVEALRLRAPNTGRELWLKSLSYARSDDQIKLLVPPEAAAAAWQDPGIAHDGRVVVQALGDMLDQGVGAQLSRFYDYRLATLVVVGPDEPEALLERVKPLFADLPPRPRKAIPAAVPPPAATGPAPRVVRVPRQKGDSMVWAVPGNPSARAWAQVLCGALNRQSRASDEPPKARVRCTYADDPRRPLLVLRALGFDPAVGPEPLIAGRLARVAAVATAPAQDPELALLIEAQRVRIETDLRFDLRAPFELASHLASASERRTPKTAGLPLRPRAETLGLPLVPERAPEVVVIEAPAEPVKSKPGAAPAAPAVEPEAKLPESAATLVAKIPELLDTRRAVLLLDTEQQVPPPAHDAAPAGPTPTGPTPAGPTPAGPTEAATTEVGK